MRNPFFPKFIHLIALSVCTLVPHSALAQMPMWPQPENAYSSSSHSPQWIEKDMPGYQASQRQGTPVATPNPSPSNRYTPPNHYRAPTNGYSAPHGYGNPYTGAPYGYAAPAYAPPPPPYYGGYGYPNNYGYVPRSNWNNFPSNPFWGSSGWPGSGFSPSNMSMPSFDIPSPSFSFPTMNAPFWN